MKYIDAFFNRMLNLCILIAKLLLAGMVAIICVSVFYRYVLNKGIKWSDEVSMLFMVYFGLISVAYGVKHRLHLSLELFFNVFPVPVKQVCTKTANAIMSILGVVMAVFGTILIQSTMGNVMAATRWPAATLYAAVPVTGILISYFSFADLIGYQSRFQADAGNGGSHL